MEKFGLPLGCQFTYVNGLWLSLVERLVRDQEAVGSNPTSPIKKRRRQGRTLRLSDSPSKMNVCSKLTFLVVAIAALHLAAFSARGGADRRLRRSAAGRDQLRLPRVSQRNLRLTIGAAKDYFC